MKNIKKLLAVLLVATLVAALFVSPFAVTNRVKLGKASVSFAEGYKELFGESCLDLVDFYGLYGWEATGRYISCIVGYGNTGKEDFLKAAYKLLNNPETDVKYPHAKVDVTEAPFPDVPVDAWYAEAVAAMKNSGIINGCDDGLFHPEREVKTGEFYAMLLRAGTRDGVDVTKAEGVDNDTHWAKGVLFNADMTYMCPPEGAGHEDDIVLRGEAISRVERLREQAVDYGDAVFWTAWEWTMARERTEGNMTFADIPDHVAIEEYMRTAHYGATKGHFVYACNFSVVKGVDAIGNLNPFGTLTRAEVAQMFYNALLTRRVGGLNFSGGVG